MRVGLLALLAGCYGVSDIDGTWEPVETIAGELAPEIGAPPAPRSPPDGVLRIATWNTEMAPDPELLAREYFESPELSRADVLMIQEVEDHDNEPGSRASRLAAALGMTFVFAPSRKEPNFLHGVMVASRYPITNARVMKLPLGTAPFHQNPRNALAVDIDLGTQILTLVDMHLDVRLGPADRIRQMHPAVTQVPDDVAIGGDFNTNPWAWVSATVPLTSTEAVLGQDQATVIDDYMTGLGFTSPIRPDEVTFNRPLLDHMRLDNVFVRGYAVVGKGIAKDVAGSDHWPVWVDLALH